MLRRLFTNIILTVWVGFATGVAAAAPMDVDTKDGGKVKLYGASHALIIGNDAYLGSWPRLSNAIKDAELVAAALKEKGFDVTLKTNMTHLEMVEAFESFFLETGEDPEARLFVWYAGHGYSESGEGYLVPIDAPDPSEGGRFKRKALSLRRMGEYVRGAQALHILSVFDSCFAGTVFNVGRNKPPASITRATTRPVRQFLTSGDAGQVVSDDGTFRKLFIRALNGDIAADLNKDGYLAASELGLFMTSQITNYSNGKQTPRNGKINDPDLDQGDFIFQIKAAVPPAAASKSPSGASSGPSGGDSSAELLFWESIKDSRNPGDFKDYLAQFPNGTFAGLAKRRVERLSNTQTAAKPPARALPGNSAEIAFWDTIKNSRNKADFEDYLKRFPNGTFGDLAKRRVAALQPTRSASLTDFGQLIRGRYIGQFSSNGKYAPITTEFFVGADGQVAGRYFYGNNIRGTLVSPQRLGPNKVVFDWREPSGTGKLTITFEQNFGSFDGFWTWAGGTGRNAWFGHRQ